MRNSYLLKNVNILDGTKDMAVQANKDILIINGRINKIDSNINETKYPVIDLTGKYVVPGLINLHAHLAGSGKVGKTKVSNLTGLVSFILSNPLTKRIGVAIEAKSAKQALLSGTTTVRSVGGVGDIDSILKKEINNNKKLGPRLIVSNEAICTQGGHMQGTVSRPFSNNEQAIKFVDYLKDIGSDLIKIMITGGVLDAKKRGEPGALKMNEDMVKAIVDHAHLLGLPVAAHDEGKQGVEIAIKCKVDTIEHGSDVDDSYIDLMKKQGQVLVTTISPAIPLSKLSDKLEGYDDDARFNSDVLLNNMVAMTKHCLSKGVTVGLGTDAGCPMGVHYDMWRELIYFTQYCDVDNKFALHTATEINSKILHLENETGTISLNKSADLLVVDNNPLNDLKTLKNPYMVFYKGNKITKKNKKIEDIDKMLDSVI